MGGGSMRWCLHRRYSLFSTDHLHFDHILFIPYAVAGQAGPTPTPRQPGGKGKKNGGGKKGEGKNGGGGRKSGRGGKTGGKYKINIQ